MAALHHALSDPEYASTPDPGKSPFLYAVRDEITNSKPEKQKRFGRAMIGLSSMTGALAVLKSPFWKALDDNTSVCDVGAGVGSFTIKLAQEHPHLKITLCDIPEVMKEAEKFWGKEHPRAVEGNRVEFVPVDFFKEIPEGRDVYYAQKISRYQVPVPNLLYNMDMTMLVMVNSKERTLADYINLGAMAGLELKEMTDFAEMHLLEFRVADADRE
ncbi:S-adenosyl-L-methionine-dependent methyltransferase [Infundibulicybe gibba]|nr:S-adenosyl-L-methionine-dependent methyltransferase [Infundibulicybe gibba]